MILKTPSMDIIDRIKAINYPSSSIYKDMSVIENYIYVLEQRIAELSFELTVALMNDSKTMNFIPFISITTDTPTTTTAKDEDSGIMSSIQNKLGLK